MYIISLCKVVGKERLRISSFLVVWSFQILNVGGVRTTGRSLFLKPLTVFLRFDLTFQYTGSDLDIRIPR